MMTLPLDDFRILLIPGLRAWRNGHDADIVCDWPQQAIVILKDGKEAFRFTFDELYSGAYKTEFRPRMLAAFGRAPP